MLRDQVLGDLRLVEVLIVLGQRRQAARSRTGGRSPELAIPDGAKRGRSRRGPRRRGLVQHIEGCREVTGRGGAPCPRCPPGGLGGGSLICLDSVGRLGGRAGLVGLTCLGDTGIQPIAMSPATTAATAAPAAPAALAAFALLLLSLTVELLELVRRVARRVRDRLRRHDAARS